MTTAKTIAMFTMVFCMFISYIISSSLGRYLDICDNVDDKDTWVNKYETS